MTTPRTCETCRHHYSGWCCRWTEPVPRIVPPDFQTIPFARADQERQPGPRWRQTMEPLGWQQHCGPSAIHWSAKDAEAAPTPAKSEVAA